MANTFRSVTAVVTTVNEIVYSAPAVTTTIVINAQITNTTDIPQKVTFSHFNGTTSSEISLVRDFTIQGNDAYDIALGNLVVNDGDSLKAYSNRDSALRITLSLLETDE